MSPPVSRETIFALSSGQPPAAIAIIRISGPAALATLERLAGKGPSPRAARLVTLRDPESGVLLDRALILFFPGPASATGEDIAELHLHGGRAVVAAIERVLAAQPGLRRATPGEFTRRAFDNGRIDLAEAEGLSDLLSAETESQRRNALALAEGALSRTIAGIQDQLVALAAAIEARIDFADEDDVPSDQGSFAQQIPPLIETVRALVATAPAERLRDGIRVVLAGPPNAGKSTLLNRLVGREAAIATPIPGTTRDLIEVPVQIDGVPFLFVDTAGLRESTDDVERIGVDRASAAIAAADILLWLGDDAPPVSQASIFPLHARCDAPSRGDAEGRLAISAVRGDGVEALRTALVSRGTSLLPRESEIAFNARQHTALRDCLEALQLAQYSSDLILLGESLRLARAALDRLTGRGGVEPLLDAIFSRFCIGK